MGANLLNKLLPTHKPRYTGGRLRPLINALRAKWLWRLSFSNLLPVKFQVRIPTHMIGVRSSGELHQFCHQSATGFLVRISTHISPHNHCVLTVCKSFYTYHFWRFLALASASNPANTISTKNAIAKIITTGLPGSTKPSASTKTVCDLNGVPESFRQMLHN